MDKTEVLNAIKELRTGAKKRNFSQTFDLQFKLHQLDLKKPESKVELFVALPYSRGKDAKVCALVGGALFNEAKEVCDRAIPQEEFKNVSSTKKDAKKLVRQFDFFIAQADIMPAVATSLGKYLGPLGRMPNPKAGAVIPPKGSIKPVYERLKKTVKLAVKNDLGPKCPVGREDMKDDEIAENILTAYNNLTNALPQHENNVKTVSLKFTMSNAVVIGGKK